MTTLEQAARQALETLERASDAGYSVECDETITALREVLEQAAPKAAPGVGNSGFDHKTAADFLSGKTVIVEALREFVHASRRAHDEKTALSAMLLSVRGVLASREAEIALLKKALLEAETATQQEAKEPAAYVHVPHYTIEGKVRPVVSFEKYQQDYADGIYSTRIPLYTAPQPAPAPLSDDVVRDAAFEAVRKKLCALPRYSFALDSRGNVRRCEDKSGNWIEFGEAHALFDPVAVDAALAAQGGKA